MYDITVIMPIYNTDKYLKEAIESVKSEKLRVEIIVIDDNSNEKTKKAIKKIIEEKENVFLIENEENKKQGYSRNVGIKQAKGEYIVFLDSDDLVDERFIDTLYENAKENNSDFSMCEWSFIKAVFV